jgi:hypothetical protein
MFGVCNTPAEPRGSSYMFWNFHPSTQKATLLALNAGPAALVSHHCEKDDENDRE